MIANYTKRNCVCSTAELSDLSSRKPPLNFISYLFTLEQPLK